MTYREALKAFSCSLLFFAATTFSMAQATTSLNGRVTDRTGAVIPGASVKLTLQATGAARENKTDESGQYQFSQLVPGSYTLVVSASGFATNRRTNMDLLVSQPATVNVTLQLAAVAEQVTVNVAEQELLNTTDATIGNAFDSQQVATLPLAQRNVPDLLSLQPGVTFMGRSDAVGGTQGVGNTSTDSRAGSVNGGRSDQSNITLDGVDVNDINNGYAFTSVLRTTQDSIAEFRVTTSNPNARGRPLLGRAGCAGHAQRFQRYSRRSVRIQPLQSSRGQRLLQQAAADCRPDSPTVRPAWCATSSAAPWAGRC